MTGYDVRAGLPPVGDDMQSSRAACCQQRDGQFGAGKLASMADDDGRTALGGHLGQDGADSSRAPLLFATSRPPFPLTYGTGIRSHRLLTGLAEAFDVTLVTQELDLGDEGRLDRDELARRLTGIRVVTVPASDRTKRWAQARSLLSPNSWRWGAAVRPHYGEALRTAVTASAARIVHFEDLGVARFAPSAPPLRVLAPHNVEHRVVRGAAEAENGMRGAFSALEWRKIRREEHRTWREMDVCLAVSEVDGAAFRAAGAARVELCPNGTDPVERLPPVARGTADPFSILFVGTGSYQPYEHGLSWFVREVLPRVRENVPAVFRAVGDRPARPLDGPGVEYVGRVESLRPFYERAHAVVVPVFYGSGTRLKVLEAMAYGRPVVSTPLGAEGLPVRAPEHLDTAVDAQTFAAALTALAAGTGAGAADVLEQRLAAARDAVRPLFWPSIVERLIELYRCELARMDSLEAA